MNIKYVHTNIITKDWERLSKFYQTVFNCVPVPPQRDLKGLWLDKGTGVKNAHLKGIHLRLPGYDENGPTLEIYQYSETIKTNEQKPNKEGFAHIAFHADDIENLLDKALKNGDSKIGELSEKHIEEAGVLKFIYISDPDGNIIELQSWDFEKRKTG